MGLGTERPSIRALGFRRSLTFSCLSGAMIIRHLDTGLKLWRLLGRATTSNKWLSGVQDVTAQHVARGCAGGNGGTSGSGHLERKGETS